MSHDSSLQILLEQIEAFRKEANEKLDDQSTRLTTLETNMKGLFDNGQPGKLTKIETRLTALERTKYYALGYISLLGTILYLTREHWLTLLQK